MRNRALHDALRDFALEAAALLTDDLKAGAEVEFDVVDEGSPRGPALYRYEPRTSAFIDERWARLRELPACARACLELGAGASAWLRVNGLRGEQAEPALRAMLERLYEDATSFGFPEERFARVYGEVELTLYRDAVRARVIAPLHGARMEVERLDLGDGLAIVRGDAFKGPHERDVLLCVLERDTPADEPISTEEAAERFGDVVTALRLWASGGVSLGTPGWRQTDEGRWQPVPLGASAEPHGDGWTLGAGEHEVLPDFFTAIAGARPADHVAWALARFEMGCEREFEADALSDYLLALRALLHATDEAGVASLSLRLAALCAEDGARREVQDRLEAAHRLERMVMGARGARLDVDSPRQLVVEVEGHLRALLRDVLCGYLDSDLKGIADDILLESSPEALMEAGERAIAVRDLRREPEPEPDPEPPSARESRFERPPAPLPVPEPEQTVTWEPELEYYDEADYEPEHEAEYKPEYEAEQDTAELEAVTVAPEPLQQPLDGVTESADWGWSDEPEDYSAPV